MDVLTVRGIATATKGSSTMAITPGHRSPTPSMGDPVAWLRAAVTLPALDELRLQRISMPSPAWAHVAAMTSLRAVLFDTLQALPDRVFGTLATLPHLASLSVSRCPATDGGLALLAGRAASPLVELHLADCDRLTTLPASVAATLERLVLTRQWALAQALFLEGGGERSSVAWPRLRHLQLQELYPPAVSTAPLPTLEQLKVPPGLQTLSLANARFRALPPEPRRVMPALPAITAVCLAGTNVTDVDVIDVVLPALGPALAWLDLRRTRITPAVVDALTVDPQRWPELAALLLADCAQLTGDGSTLPKRGLQALPSLAYVDMRSCPLTDPLGLVLRLHPAVRVRWQDHDEDDADRDADAALRRHPSYARPRTWTELGGFRW